MRKVEVMSTGVRRALNAVAAGEQERYSDVRRGSFDR
jgi:hypothetical protein